MTEPIEVFRKDYKPSSWQISDISLSFILHETETLVSGTYNIQSSDASVTDLILDGEDLQLVSVCVDGKALTSEDYTITASTLHIKAAVFTIKCELSITVKVRPIDNLELSGLYASKSSNGYLLSTQCEALGFRRIIYSLDRPDILSIYTVRMEADKTAYPILLSNGNRVDGGDIPETGRHWALWHDPFPKPSYLFAIVAGDLGSIHSSFTTKSGKEVALGIYCDKEYETKLDHAMYCIKKSMKWDEETFGLECDLDMFNIVAVSSFNMGAMENKGLNIFNAAYIVADPKTSTDNNYISILGIIGHEYFHNWTGNRVTVRDWFQLTLKEGLTVFRDQWFTADETGHAVKRIEDVCVLRSSQFSEDQGPMAHPIRPDSYIAMDNFYTATVYEKGAEIIRIFYTLLGVEGFKAGMREYFRRHDGSAVTCDDFRNAMADANNVDLSQMQLWYSQAGTPVVTAEYSYDKEKCVFHLKLSQSIPSTPNQPADTKKPLLIPITFGLLSKTTKREIIPSTVLKLTEVSHDFTFDNIIDEVTPVPSLLRDFSAPVRLIVDQSDEDLSLLMAYDTDSFNKWEAANRFATRVIFDAQQKIQKDEQVHSLSALYLNAVQGLLKQALNAIESKIHLDLSIVAYTLQLPDLDTLIQEMTVIDIDSLSKAKTLIYKHIATSLQNELLAVYHATNEKSSEYKITTEEVGRRRLHNTCLDILCALQSDSSMKLALAQFETATCMTDKLEAIRSILSFGGVSFKEHRIQAIESFYREAHADALMLNKWFSIQASADVDNVIDEVIALKSHEQFTLTNPNRARSLIGAFANNLTQFHRQDGRGYEFLANCILEIDALNPQVAARLSSNLNMWKRFDANRQSLMKTQLQRIRDSAKLSKDTFEIVNLALAN